jgi:radical SAM protein with 4Fe4S-binding SPASM domain
MKTEDIAPTNPPKLDFKTFQKELGFIKSLKDFKYFLQKLSLALPRVTGTIDRWAKAPPTLEIEPTRLSNINSTACNRQQSARPAGNMNFDLFRKISDNAARIGVKRVGLYLSGEPLMHPEIVDMIRYIKSGDMAFHLTTNGALLTAALGEAILRSGVTSADYVTISLPGFTQAVHETVMKGINHHQVVENVEKFLEKRRILGINGPVTETVFYSVPENEHELQPFLDYWSRVADHAINGGTAEHHLSDSVSAIRPRTGRCAHLWDSMAVFWNGDVPFCSEDMDGKQIIGNLRDQSIEEIWQSKELLEIQKLHKAGKFNKISACEYCDRE